MLIARGSEHHMVPSEDVRILERNNYLSTPHALATKTACMLASSNPTGLLKLDGLDERNMSFMPADFAVAERDAG